MDITPQQKALGINEMLTNIYGFVLGTDLDTIIEKMQIQMRLISTHFNTCFITYLKSVPLKLFHRVTKNGNAPRERSIVQFMIKYQVSSLFELLLESSAVDLQQVRSNLSGLDFSNLSVLNLGICIYPSRRGFPNEVQSFHHLFSEASSVTQLSLSRCDNNTIPYKEFLSHFPILKSLEVEFIGTLPIDKDHAMKAIEVAPQLERLVTYRVRGGFMLRSESLKFLNLRYGCRLDSICLVCPSLEELVCLYHPSIRNFVIGNTSGSVLVERFGNTNRAFIDGILEHIEIINGICTVNRIDIVSIIPSDFIVSTDTNLFQVGNDCRIIILSCND